MYKPFFSLLLVVLVEAITAVVNCLKDHLTRHMYPYGQGFPDDDHSFA